MLLYKYSSLNVKPKNCYALSNLKDNIVYFQDIIKLNDPFETVINIRIVAPSDTTGILKAKRILRAHIDKVFELDVDSKHLQKKKEFKRILKEAKTKISLEQILNQLYEGLETFFNDRSVNDKVSCFTPRCDSELMWGHYGAGMSGICLGYRFPENSTVFEIEYSDKIPEIDFLELIRLTTYDEKEQDKGMGILKSFYGHKRKCWSYEEEVRAVSSHNKLSITENTLEEIIVGFKAPVESLKEIKSILENKRYLPALKIARIDGIDGIFIEEVGCIDSIIEEFEMRDRKIDNIVKGYRLDAQRRS